ncbi:hypothetical protein [Halocatena marina]|uniref:hypothetical protein n=1 Tax=Halocatena marina TaxID=2934937 RepID=UPI00200CD21E|nr:hypothetical protein [Halocatena marina]
MSNDTITYRVEWGRFRHKGTRYEVGEIFEADPSLAEDWPHTLTAVVDGGEKQTDGQQTFERMEPSQSESEFDASEFVDRSPMDPVLEDIEAGMVDEHLDTVLEAEKGGRDRDGVRDAIADRREELNEE